MGLEVTNQLWWLTYRQHGDIVVFIQPASFQIAARLKAQLAAPAQDCSWRAEQAAALILRVLDHRECRAGCPGNSQPRNPIRMFTGWGKSRAGPTNETQKELKFAEFSADC